MVKVRNDARLASEMERDGLDAVIAFSMENMLYLSGALFALQDNIRERMAAAIFCRDGRDALLCATNETTSVQDQTHVARLVGYVEFERTPMEALAELLQEMGLADGRLGIEMRYLMAGPWEELKQRLPRARLTGGDRAVEVARAIKTPEHVAIIAEASRHTEAAIAEGFAHTRRGDSERALADRIVAGMIARGCDLVRHAVITAGENAAKAHPFPSRTKLLVPGDAIRVDVGGLFDGFGTDLARMAYVGAPSAEQLRLYTAVRNCTHELGQALRPGVLACEVYEHCVEIYARVGFPGFRRDHVGHSMSILGGHDEPMLHARNRTPLEAGMVMALEPIMRDALGRRVTVEDVFVIEEGGSRLLTDGTDTRSPAIIR